MLVAEAKGILDGYVTTKQRVFENIVVESDLKELFSWLNRSINQGNWEVFPTLYEIRRAGAEFRSCD